MRALDTLRLAAGALASQRRRTLLSLSGVAIGVAAVLVMTALGEGAREYARGQFRAIGSNILAVVPGRVETSGALPGVGSAPNDLTIQDALALRRALPELQNVAPLALGNETLSHGALSRNVIVLGSTAEMLNVRGLEIERGEFLPAGPWDRGASVVVLGYTLARTLFAGESPVGRTVRLGDWRLRVVGSLRTRGVHLGVDLDEAVYVPVATAQRMFDTTTLFRVLLQLRPGYDPRSLQPAVRELLRERHGGEEDFTLLTQDAVLGAVTRILDMLTLALAGIAAVSLVVAGVGVMNVMLVSVSERAREIGLQKALGATAADVLAQFLVEAALLCGAGGLAGLILGELAVRALAWRFPTLDPHTPLWAALAALALALLVGALSGALPARRAMKLDAVAALARR